MVRILHIAEPADWADAVAVGSYTQSTRGQSLDEVGFIHCSQPHQVRGVLDLVYTDVDHDLLLLVIETEGLTSPWQLDDVPGSDAPFPHIYGPLAVAAVVHVEQIRRTSEGWTVPTAYDA